tara:strand:- start:175 stop:276 length:102 start_codon:yes stop_codon:yes gene_type:complete
MLVVMELVVHCIMQAAAVVLEATVILEHREVQM